MPRIRRAFIFPAHFDRQGTVLCLSELRYTGVNWLDFFLKMIASKLESARKLLADGIPPKEVAKNLGISVPTLYRHCPAGER